MSLTATLNQYKRAQSRLQKELNAIAAQRKALDKQHATLNAVLNNGSKFGNGNPRMKDNYLASTRRPFVTPQATPSTCADYIRFVLRQHPEMPMAIPDIRRAVLSAAKGKFARTTVDQTIINMATSSTSGIQRHRHGWYKATV